VNFHEIIVYVVYVKLTKSEHSTKGDSTLLRYWGLTSFQKFCLSYSTVYQRLKIEAI